MMMRRRRQNIDNSIYIMMMLMATTASWLSLCLSGKRKDEGQTRVVPKIRERSFKFEKFRLSLRYLFSTSSCCVEQSSFFFLWLCTIVIPLIRGIACSTTRCKERVARERVLLEPRRGTTSTTTLRSKCSYRL
jgi:hypothetical protein